MIIPNNVMSVEHGSDVQFKFIPDDGYSADIFDGETGLTAVDEVYTVSNVTSAHTISVVSKDIQAPSVTPSVSDAEEWRQEKKLLSWQPTTPVRQLQCIFPLRNTPLLRR